MGAVMEMDVMMVRLLRTEEGLWDYGIMSWCLVVEEAVWS